MTNKQVLSSQSLLNKAVECTGSIENAFAMTLLNGFSITDDLIIGTEVLIPQISNKVVVGYFNEKSPATAISKKQENELIEKLGIGTMVINSTFVVG